MLTWQLERWLRADDTPDEAVAHAATHPPLKARGRTRRLSKEERENAEAIRLQRRVLARLQVRPGRPAGPGQVGQQSKVMNLCCV